MRGRRAALLLVLVAGCLARCLEEDPAVRRFLTLDSGEQLPIRVEVNAWETHAIHAYIAAILLREAMGYDVELVTGSDLLHVPARLAGCPADASVDCTLADLLDAPETMLNMEFWVHGKETQYNKWVHGVCDDAETCDKLVASAGPVGSVGNSGLYVFDWAVDEQWERGLIGDHWRSLLLPDVRADYEAAMANETINALAAAAGACEEDGVAVPEPGTGCSEALPGWLPPLNSTANTSIPLYHHSYSFDPAAVPQMVNNRDLDVSIVFLGDALFDVVRDRHEQRQPALFYWWEPDPFIVALGAAQRLFFPRYTTDCYSLQTGNSYGGIDCDFPSQELETVYWAQLDTLAPDVPAMLQQFSLPEASLRELLDLHSATGGDLNSSEVACQWVRDNEAVWGTWIPEPAPCDSSFLDYEVHECDQRDRRVVYSWLRPSEADPTVPVDCLVETGIALPPDEHVDCDFLREDSIVVIAARGAVVACAVLAVVCTLFGLAGHATAHDLTLGDVIAMAIGTLASLSTALVTGVEPNEQMCSAQPVLITVGLDICMAAFIVRCKRLVLLAGSEKDAAGTVTAERLFQGSEAMAAFHGARQMLLLVCIDVGINAAVVVVEPISVKITTEETAYGVLVTSQACAANTDGVFVLSGLYKVGLLLYALQQSFRMYRFNTSMQSLFMLTGLNVIVCVALLAGLTLAFDEDIDFFGEYLVRTSATMTVTVVALVAFYGAALRRNFCGHSRNTHSTLMAVSASFLIPFEDLELKENVGGGSFGDVIHARWRATHVAVKTFRGMVGEEQMAAFGREAAIMASLHHPNVVLFMGYCNSPPALIIEFLSRGSLHDILHRGTARALHPSMQLSVLRQSATGMDFLHQWTPPIIHADLKSPNILVDNNWTCKIADFGLSKLRAARAGAPSTAGTSRWSSYAGSVGGATGGSSQGLLRGGGFLSPPSTRALRAVAPTSAQSSPGTTATRLPPLGLPKQPDSAPASAQTSVIGLGLGLGGGGSSGGLMNGAGPQQQPARPRAAETTVQGSILWCSPEVLSAEQVSPASDVYAFGVVIFEVLWRELPYKNVVLQAVPLQVAQGKRPTDFCTGINLDMTHRGMGDQFVVLKELMERCWAVDPGDRPPFYEIAGELERASVALFGDSFADMVVFPNTDLDGGSSSIDSRTASIAPSIDENDLVLGRRIGEGAFGAVYQASYLGTQVAVKKMYVSGVKSDVLLEFRHEVELMNKMHHPNIVMLIGCVEALPTLLIVCELISRGSLFDIYHQEKRLQPLAAHIKRTLRAGLDMARGMTYLHKQDILHRDLKSQNIFIEDSWRAKIGDFGMSRLRDSAKTMTRCGSPLWMAPEVLRSERYGKAVDVYATGVIIWEVLAWDEPYPGMSSMEIMKGVAMRGLRPDIPAHCPPELAALLAETWTESPDDRLTFQGLVEALEALLPDAGR